MVSFYALVFLPHKTLFFMQEPQTAIINKAASDATAATASPTATPQTAAAINTEAVATTNIALSEGSPGVEAAITAKSRSVCHKVTYFLVTTFKMWLFNIFQDNQLLQQQMSFVLHLLVRWSARLQGSVID